MRLVLKLNVYIVAILLTVIAVSTSSCSSEKRHRVLTFFFDGVPSIDTSNTASNLPTEEGEMVVNRKATKSDFLYHKPYEQEKCTSCHEGGFSNRLLMKMPDLCYSCHTNFKNEFKQLHGPVSSGNCLECHNQHMSKYDKLLDVQGQAICLKCHQKEQVLQSNKHKNIAQRNCTECHNPHGGDNSGMLNKGICNECHKSFKSDYTYLHGPAATDNCTACHGSHNIHTKSNLDRIGQKLCLYCHNEEQILSSKTHKKIGKTNCLECHNPHGENNKHFLRAQK